MGIPLRAILRELDRRNISFAITESKTKKNYDGVQNVIKILQKLHNYKKRDNKELFKLEFFIEDLREKVPYYEPEVEAILMLGAGRIRKARKFADGDPQEVYSAIGELIRKLDKWSAKTEKALKQEH